MTKEEVALVFKVRREHLIKYMVHIFVHHTGVFTNPAGSLGNSDYVSKFQMKFYNGCLRKF